MFVEEFDQLGKVGERAGQPVDLVDNDHIDPVSANVVRSAAGQFRHEPAEAKAVAFVAIGIKLALIVLSDRYVYLDDAL